MILDKFVTMRWNHKNIKHYENLGYKYTKYNDCFSVKVEDLQLCSGKKINVNCDNCCNPIFMTYQTYIEQLRDNKYYCKQCYAKLFSGEIINKSKLKNSISFGCYCIQNIDENFMEKYWGTENTISPFDILFKSNIKIWIKCQEKDYHGEYLIYAYDFSNGVRCGYCSGAKVHRLDSFGAKYPQFVSLWSDKNEQSLYEYKPYSNMKVWFKCENKIHDDYERKIVFVEECECRCPECSRLRQESFLQEKVRKYLSENLGYELKHEYNCSIIPVNPKTKQLLPFDNEIIFLKLLVETMGCQHEELNGFNTMTAKHKGTTPQEELEYIQWKDEYKKQYALSQGYFYLAIPYWTEKDESYKELIDEKIKEIVSLNA